MRRFLSFAAAIVCVATLTLATAYACDHDKAAASNTGHAGMACCNKKGAGTTAAARVASPDDYVVPALALESGAAAAGHDCPMMKAKALAMTEGKGADCPMHAKMMAATTASTAVAGQPRCAHQSGAAAGTLAGALAGAQPGVETKQTGRVVCARCELKKSETCMSVFQARGEDSYTPLCGEGISQDLMKLTRHGELEVTIQGHLKKTEDGSGSVLCVEGFAVGSI